MNKALLSLLLAGIFLGGSLTTHDILGGKKGGKKGKISPEAREKKQLELERKRAEEKALLDQESQKNVLAQEQEQKLLAQCAYAKDFEIRTIQGYQEHLVKLIDVMQLEYDALVLFQKLIPLPEKNLDCFNEINALLSAHTLGEFYWKNGSEECYIKSTSGDDYLEERKFLATILRKNANITHPEPLSTVKKIVDEFLKRTDIDTGHMKKIFDTLERFGEQLQLARTLRKDLVNYHKQFMAKMNKICEIPILPTMREAIQNWQTIVNTKIGELGEGDPIKQQELLQKFIGHQLAILKSLSQALQHAKKVAGTDYTQQAPQEVISLHMPFGYLPRIATERELIKTCTHTDHVRLLLIDLLTHREGLSCLVGDESLHALTVDVQKKNSLTFVPLIALCTLKKWTSSQANLCCTRHGLYRTYLAPNNPAQQTTCWQRARTIPWWLISEKTCENVVDQLVNSKTHYNEQGYGLKHQQTKKAITYAITAPVTKKIWCVSALESPFGVEIDDPSGTKIFVWKKKQPVS